MADTKRLSLDLAPEADTKLTAMAARIGGTKVDVIRRALALLEYALQANGAGEKLSVTDSSGHILRDVVVL